MPRHKSLFPKVRMNIRLPLELRARLDLILLSDLEGRVPLGDYSDFFTARTREHLEWKTLNFGDSGDFVRGPVETIKRLKQLLDLVQP